jgi:hypothetical protein
MNSYFFSTTKNEKKNNPYPRFVVPLRELCSTVGFVTTKLTVGKRNVRIYDLGGHSGIRNIWENYLEEVWIRFVFFFLFAMETRAQNVCGLHGDGNLHSK